MFLEIPFLKTAGKNIAKVNLLLCLFFICSTGYAQSSTTPTNFYSVSSGNWSDISIWSLSPYTNVSAPATRLPSSIDYVMILPGTTVAANGLISCSELTIGSGTNYGSLNNQYDVNAAAELNLGSYSLNVVNYFRLYGGRQSNQTATLSANSASISVGASISVSGGQIGNTTNYSAAELLVTGTPASSASITASSISILHSASTFTGSNLNLNLSGGFNNQAGTVNLSSVTSNSTQLNNTSGGNVSIEGTITATSQISNAENSSFTIPSGTLVTEYIGNAGTFNLGSTKATISGTSSIRNQSSSGYNPASFTLGAGGEITLKGSVVQPYSGTTYGTFSFDPTSTIKFAGTVNQIIPYISTLTFGNVEVTNPVGLNLDYSYITANLSIAGDFILKENGKLYNRGVSLNLTNSGKSFTMEQGSELILENYTTLANAIAASNINIDLNSTVTYSTNNYASAVSAGTYGKLKIQGTKSLGGNVTISGSSYVNTLNLAGYSLHIGNNDLTVDSYISGATLTNYVKVGTGKVIKNNVGNSFNLFPIGTATSYTPVSIVNYGTSQAISVGVQNGVSLNGEVVTSGVVNKTWEITPAGTGANINLTLQWNASDQTTGFSPSSCLISHYDSGLGYWESTGTSYGAASGSGPYTRTRNNITSFSPFAVIGPGSPLPVELVSFNGKANAEGNRLTWATATEKNSSHFIIERSENGREFSSIATVKAAGNSTETQQYTYLDKIRSNQTQYYRLKQVDLDGSFSYSPMIAINSTGSNADIVAYPNPFNESLTLELTAGTKSENALIMLSSLEGKTVYQQYITLSEGHKQVTLTNMPKLPTGMYVLKIQQGDTLSVQKVTKL